ncbi:MAG: amidohydrolase family protein [Pseudomonadales bacterium]
MTERALLIRNAELLSTDGCCSYQDVRVVNGTIQAIGTIRPVDSDQIIDANRCLLLPGLQDHHVHLMSFAASLNSVRCGPPEVNTEDELSACLNSQSGTDWLRGNGYHESVMPNLDRHWLDNNGPDRPIRLQHRSGRLWILNTAGLDIIRSASAKFSSLDRRRLLSDDGRLYDVDELLGRLTRAEPLAISQASKQLAAYGITGINDMTPSNDLQTWDGFAEMQSSNQLLQKVRLSGRAELADAQACMVDSQLTLGETKVHLHDSSLPELSTLIDSIARSHDVNRNVAIHCVTEVELVFGLAAFREAGVRAGDRIEHASVVPPALVEQLLELRLGVVTQPNFLYERGDAYLKDIPCEEHAFLYRVASLVKAGVPVAFGTDSPFGSADPWVAIKAAVDRRTLAGEVLGGQECITSESALKGFLGELADPFTLRAVTPGEPADLCLLDLPWKNLSTDLSSTHVRMTIRDGELIYSRE